MAFTGNAVCKVFKTGLLDGSFDFGSGTSDVYKIALYTNAATLDETTTAYTTDNEVVAAGYSAGGNTLTVNQTPTTGDTGDIAYISFSDTSWSGAITARGALIYKVSGNAVCVLDFGADKTSSSTFEVQFPAVTNTAAIIRIK